MRRWLVMCTALVFAAVNSPEGARAQAEGMPQMGAPEEMKALVGMDGTYDVSVKFKMAPDAPWSESVGKATVEQVLEGCAQKMTFEGTMMGMPMHGISYLVYNRETKEWQTTWIDNFMASMSYYTGKMENGALTVSGIDHMMGMKFHTRATSYDMTENSWKWKMEQSVDGGATYADMMMMEYTRVQ